MSKLDLFLLGTPRALRDGALLETERRKAMALLAYLAVEPRSHPREELAALLWPDFERASALSYLRRTLWELNNLLGKEWLATDRQFVRLIRTQTFWLDTQQFRDLIQEYRAQPSSSANKLQLLEEAIHLYKADFLSGFTIQDSAAFEEWQRLQSAALQREFRWTLLHLVSEQESMGDVEAALVTAHRWLALDDLNEEAHRSLIRLYAMLGDRTSAIRQYELLTQRLYEELAVTPQQETADLYRAVVSGHLSAVTQRAMKDRQNDQTKQDTGPVSLNLPRFPTRFIGRRPEVKQIVDLMAQDQTHLLTLLGPGGSGKTRLAVEAAEELSGQFPDGVYFVPLAPLQDSTSIISAAAKILDFSFYREVERPRQQLLNYLRQQNLLLIFDNFEHLIDSDSLSLIQELLSNSSHLRIMVTSRSRLNISEERLFPVAGMKLPELSAVDRLVDSAPQVNAYSGLMLFTDRAARIKPGFQITQENLSDIVNICRLVEGMPLGIELAASWLELLPAHEILSEIRRSLDFLETSISDVPDRQRSIRAVFDSSWALLAEDERDVVMRLSIFPGTISRKAAEEVGRSSLRTLLSLVNKSWLQPLEDGRYQIHELLRQFAQERLQKDPHLRRTVHDEQLHYFANLLHGLITPLRRSGQKEALDQINLEFENIRAAWEWALLNGEIDLLSTHYIDALYHFADMRMAGADLIPMLDRVLAQLSPTVERSAKDRLTWAVFLIVKIHCLAQEGLYHHATALSQKIFPLLEDGIDPDQLAHWYYVLLHHYGWGVDLEVCKGKIEERLPLLRSSSDRWPLANVLSVYGYFFSHTDLEKSIAIFEEALSLMQMVGDIYGQAQIYNGLGSAEWSLGWKKSEPSLAIPHLQKARDIYATLGVKGFQEGQYYRELAELSISIGEIERAFGYFEQEIQIHKQRGNRRLVINSLHWTSMQAVRYKDIEYALKLRKECQQMLRRYDDPFQLAYSTWEMGELLRVAGDLEQAKIWFHEANTLFETIQDKVGMGYYHRGLGDLALSKGDYLEAQRRFNRFNKLVWNQQNDWYAAYAHNGLGRAALGLGDTVEAQKHFEEALYTGYEIISVPDLCMLPLCGFAQLWALTGKLKDAVILSSFVAGHDLTWREIKQRATELMTAAARELSPAAAEAAQEKGQSTDLVEVIETILSGASRLRK
ncbi:MAG: BTAD domain-containing putative transcriptional regulator [Candidatus Promineifilaceae bacterium]|nr:BTAD domain-containing putative transcriptional regulator [Candidatus Promineifilaceae bacterium]